MRICHAFIFFSIRFAGGTSDLMYKICKAQVKQGHKPVVYSGHYRFDQDLANSLRGVEFRVVRSWFDKLGFSIMPKLAKLFRIDVKELDVVHMHLFRSYQNLILHRFCRKYNVPYVLDAHGAVPYYTRKKLIKKLFDRIWGKRILNDAAYLIAETKIGVKEMMH